MAHGWGMKQKTRTKLRCGADVSPFTFWGLSRAAETSKWLRNYCFVSVATLVLRKYTFWLLFSHCTSYVVIERLDFVSRLFSDCMMSEWSARKRNLVCEEADWDKDKPQAPTIPRVAMCMHLSVSECDCEHAGVCVWNCLYAHVCLCGPLEAGNRGKMEVPLIISPEAATWD